jgi:hypothetical protein
MNQSAPSGVLVTSNSPVRLLFRKWSNNFIIYFCFILRMDTFGTVKHKLESVRMALQFWRVRFLLCNFLESRKKNTGKNTLRVKYVVYLAVFFETVSSVRGVTLVMHAEMRVSSRNVSVIGTTLNKTGCV